MKQGLALEAKNEPAVAAGMATIRTISETICVRVMSPPRAARGQIGATTARLGPHGYRFIKLPGRNFTPPGALRR